MQDIWRKLRFFARFPGTGWRKAAIFGEVGFADTEILPLNKVEDTDGRKQA